MWRFPLRKKSCWIFGLLICLLALVWASWRRTLAPRNGYFTVTQREGVCWLLAPDGNRFFSLGVNVVDRGGHPNDKHPKSPGYHAVLHYPNDSAWAEATRNRLRAWEFNTIGGWSDVEILQKNARPPMPYTVCLQFGSSLAMPWEDPFGEKFEQSLDGFAREQIAPRSDDPQLIGWFTDNELVWYDQTIFAYYIRQTTPSATRRALMKTIQDHYKGDFKKLLVDFDPGKAATFKELDKSTALRLRPGGRGTAVIDEFMSALADRYYQSVHDAIRRYDSHHLILGDRYSNYYCPAVVKASARYVDVVSTNFCCVGWDDGDLARFYLDGLHELTGKPLLISEYYFCANENTSGNQNGRAFPTVSTQAQRAGAFERTIRSLAANPHVVGAHWFEYYDETPGGGVDHEDFNMGLIDVHDMPYALLTAAATRINPQVQQLHADAGDRGVSANGSAGSADLLAGWNAWDKAKSYLKPEPGFPFADLYGRSDDRFVYLAVYASDFLDAKAYPDGASLESERMELMIQFKGAAKQLKIHFGPGSPAHMVEPGIALTAGSLRLRSWEDATRQSLMIAIADAQTADLFVAHGPIEFEASLSRHDVSTPMRWKGTIQTR